MSKIQFIIFVFINCANRLSDVAIHRILLTLVFLFFFFFMMHVSSHVREGKDEKYAFRLKLHIADLYLDQKPELTEGLIY